MQKCILFFVIFLFSWSMAFSYPEITLRLSKEIEKSLKDGSYIKTIITFKDQVDILSLDKDLYRQRKKPSERSKIVIESLKNLASKSQASLIKKIHSFSKNEIKNFKSFWIINMLALEAKASTILELIKEKDILKMDIDGEIILDASIKENIVSKKLPGSAEPGLKVINAHLLWELGYTGAGHLVMNIDTGVDGNHPALGWRWRGHHVADSLAWFDPVYGTTFPNDGDNHGTATMGIACGYDSSTHDTIGAAIGAEWIASNALWGSPLTSYVIAAFQWAMNPDGNPATSNDMPDAINCSWYDPYIGFCDSTYAQVFNSVEAAGIAIVFSAGAGGPSPQSIVQPVNINTNIVNVWATGAIDGTQPGYPIKSSSGRGPSQCYTGFTELDIKPEACAPGVDIRTSVVNSNYSIYSGNSMATAHVSGAIVLLKEIYPHLTGHEIKLALYNTAMDLGVFGEDNIYGMGLIDLWAAYISLSDTVNPIMVVNPKFIIDTLFVNQKKSFPVQIANIQHLNSILNYNVFTDTSINWLSVNPDSGQVQQMDSNFIYINLDTEGLLTGNYTTEIFISGNDSINFMDTILLNVEIIDAPICIIKDSVLIGLVSENQVDSTYFWINNLGNHELFYRIEESDSMINTLSESSKSFGDTIGTLNIEAITGTGNNRGFGFDGEFIWISSHDNIYGNKLFKIDLSGNLISQYYQGTTSLWGMGDMAFDGVFLYAGDVNGLYKIDPQNGSVINLGSFPNVRAIVNNDIRALTYDPITGNFWAANQNSPICVFDTNDTIIATYPNNIYGITGLAWDNWDYNGPYLWVFAMQYPSFLEVIQLSPFSGVATGKRFTGYTGNNGLAGSCTIIPDAYIKGSALFAGLQYESNDRIYYYDIEVETGLPWIDVYPDSGYVIENDSTQIKVYFYGKYPGIEDGFLNIYSNDPLNPVHNIYVCLETLTNINSNNSKIPEEFYLYQNHPNPFNPTTTIRYDLKARVNVKLTIYNTLGQKVRTLVNSNMAVGLQTVIWDGLNDYGDQVSTGVYIYRIEVDDPSSGLGQSYIKSRKMIFLK